MRTDKTRQNDQKGNARLFILECTSCKRAYAEALRETIKYLSNLQQIALGCVSPWEKHFKAKSNKVTKLMCMDNRIKEN